MLDLLLVIAVVIPVWYAYRRSVARGLVAINHVTTFSFGFLVYWITPILVGLYGSRLASQLSEVYFSLFDRRVVAPYLAVCIGLYLCFAIGDWLGGRLFRPRSKTAPRVPKVALSLVTAAGCALALYTSYTLRAELLLPYRHGIPPTARGTLAACLVLFGTVALMFTLDCPSMSWRERLAVAISLPLMAGCAVFLWLGTRLYVASLFLMFAVYQSNFQRRFRLRTVVWGAVGLVMVLGSVAMWRSHVGTADAAFTILQEPVLTSLSLIHYLDFKGIAWTNPPVYLASDFLNLIPSLVLPGKASLLKRLPVYTPLGGLHLFRFFQPEFRHPRQRDFPFSFAHRV